MLCILTRFDRSLAHVIRRALSSSLIKALIFGAIAFMSSAKFTSNLSHDFTSLIMLLADRFTISKFDGVISWPRKDKQIGQLSFGVFQLDLFNSKNRLFGLFRGFFSQIYSTIKTEHNGLFGGVSVRFIQQ